MNSSGVAAAAAAASDIEQAQGLAPPGLTEGMERAQEVTDAESSEDDGSDARIRVPQQQLRNVHEQDEEHPDLDNGQGGKYPSVLHKLIEEAQDDDWQSVIQRVARHPEEVAQKGKPGGQNALHLACTRYPPLEAVEAMAQSWPDATTHVNHDGETPLHTACYGASEGVQMALLRYSNPLSVVQRDRFGDCPLHLTARAGATFPLMQAMVNANPKSIGLRNKKGATPFWFLRRSYLEAESIEEIIEDQSDDFRLDFEQMELFLRASYPTSYRRSPFVPFETVDGFFMPQQQLPHDNGTSALTDSHEDASGGAAGSAVGSIIADPVNTAFLVHAAAGTPACPREVLRFLTEVLPEQAVQYDELAMTPLLRACQAQVVAEPEAVDESEDRLQLDGVGGEAPGQPNDEGNNHHREDGEVQVDDGIVRQRLEELDLNDNNAIDRTLDVLNDEGENSALRIVLDWNPRAASYADSIGRLPLAHAIISGKTWRGGIEQVVSACPRSLECRDNNNFYMFQLAAIHSPDLDTIYSIVRLLPELLTFSATKVKASTAAANLSQSEAQDGQAATDDNRKKRKE